MYRLMYLGMCLCTYIRISIYTYVRMDEFICKYICLLMSCIDMHTHLYAHARAHAPGSRGCCVRRQGARKGGHWQRSPGERLRGPCGDGYSTMRQQGSGHTARTCVLCRLRCPYKAKAVAPAVSATSCYGFTLGPSHIQLYSGLSCINDF